MRWAIRRAATRYSCRVTPEMTHLACPRCAWRRCKTCACPGMSCVLRLAPHTDGGAILRHFKRDATLALAGGKPVLSRLRTHCELEAALDPVLCKLSNSVGGASVQVDTSKDGQEGDAKLFGRARTYDAATEERYWQHIYDTMQFRPNGPAHVFAIEIDSAAYVRFTGEGTMNWLTWPGGEWRMKASGG